MKSSSEATGHGHSSPSYLAFRSERVGQYTRQSACSSCMGYLLLHGVSCRLQEWLHTQQKRQPPHAMTGHPQDAEDRRERLYSRSGIIFYGVFLVHREKKKKNMAHFCVCETWYWPWSLQMEFHSSKPVTETIYWFLSSLKKQKRGWLCL